MPQNAGFFYVPDHQSILSPSWGLLVVSESEEKEKKDSKSESVYEEDVDDDDDDEEVGGLEKSSMW